MHTRFSKAAMAIPMATTLLLTTTSAHMILNSPTPFSPNGNKAQNAPIDGGSFLFPCSFGPAANWDFSVPTKVAAGSSFLANFSGSAIHAGGSCQFSLSETASTDPADWKVIHTIIGGCPGTAIGNLVNMAVGGADPVGAACTKPDAWNEKECVRSFTVPVPKDVPSSKYFFAWTWFNKLGNREMYMQCAPVEVIGGGSDAAALDKLPSIFVANVDKQPCVTEQGYGGLNIPNPGSSVVTSNLTEDATDDRTLGASCKALYGDPASALNAPEIRGTPGFPQSKPAVTLTPYKNLGSNPTPFAPLLIPAGALPSGTPAGALSSGTSASALPSETTSAADTPTTTGNLSSSLQASPTATSMLTVYTSSSASAPAAATSAPFGLTIQPFTPSSSTAATASPVSPTTTSLISSLAAPTISSLAAAPAAPTVSSPVSPAASAAPTAAPAPAGTSSPNAPTGGSSCPAGRVPCPAGTTDGAFLCVSTTQFAICDRGCMIPMAVATGTTCVNGAIMRRRLRVVV